MKRTSRHSPLSADTRENILCSAEQLFARHGFDATSIRDITKLAGANLGAINYHFGSKDGLVQAIFDRRLTPLNQARIQLLDQVEKAPSCSLADILRAFIEPMVEDLVTNGDAAQSFARLLCRCLQEPNSERVQMIHEHFEEVIHRFHLAFSKNLPTLPENEIFWNINFVFGACHHAIDTWSRFSDNPFAKPVGHAHAKELSRNELIERLIHFSEAGIRAEASVERYKA